MATPGDVQMKATLIHLLQETQETRENPNLKITGPDPGRNSADAGENAECVRRIAASIEHMLQHLNQPLSVARLAAAANLSQSHFFALFRRCTGGAPIDFLIRLRMERACHLLKTTRLGVREIGAMLGYDDPFYFSRAFKAVHHLSPNKYRQTATALNGSHDESRGQHLSSNQFQSLPKMVISQIDDLNNGREIFLKEIC